MDYPRGSEWRKWDLHVHTPGTKANDCYTKKDGNDDWEQFCKTIHDSDVSVVGIADYFSLDGYFAFKKHYEQFFPGDPSKFFLPNLELRIPEIVNDEGQNVNVHVIFRPDITEDTAKRLLTELKTKGTTGSSKKPVACIDLRSESDFTSATVSMESLKDALGATFGPDRPIEEVALIVTSAKGDGIRPGGKGSKGRKNLLVDEIDKHSHAFFGGPNSKEHFLRNDRLESGELIAPKPVFDGSDSHSFEDLKERLGVHKVEDGHRSHVTWIKADLTFEGLLQTLIEPADRVAIQAAEPDIKQPFQYIESVTFSSTLDFPSSIVFNRNLNAVIGSRSSGKSALLAYIAYAVDPSYTIQQQTSASGLDSEEVGPAAGKTWRDVEGITCQVNWESGEATSGKVIYIPQNSLYHLSRQPQEVNRKIEPALFRAAPEFDAFYRSAREELKSLTSDLRSTILKWFSLSNDIGICQKEMTDLGDKSAIEVTRQKLSAVREEAKKRSTLTDEEHAKFQEVSEKIEDRRIKLTEAQTELASLANFVSESTEGVIVRPTAIQIDISVQPNAGQLPATLAGKFQELVDSARSSLIAELEDEVITVFNRAGSERSRLSTEIVGIQTEHAELISKHSANEELDTVSKEIEKLVVLISQIDAKEAKVTELDLERDSCIEKIKIGLAQRERIFDSIKVEFAKTPKSFDRLTFGVEIELNDEQVVAQSSTFNRNKTGFLFAHKGDDVDVIKAQSEPDGFLNSLRSGAQELNKGKSKEEAALSILLLNPEVRFTAVLDTDIIGGFGASTMTPGKQALFALILLLGEMQEPWPLLIDQPEDDLDSRSIYDTIVPYLSERKKERQIIMVSHDANLVIGADSEEVIVANRNAADSPNNGSRTFEYLTGSLEHTQPLNLRSSTTLGRFGIREHACEILDGGEEAFQKRRDKYKL